MKDKRKVYLLTFHKERSYGAMLQCYALSKVLGELGCKVSLINFSMRYKQGNNLRTRFKNITRTFFYSLWLYDLKMYRFRSVNYPALTGRFTELQQMENFPWEKESVFIVGSDQVWNEGITARLAPVFYFSFLKDDSLRRISYAASFGGLETVSESCARALRKFSAVSVREDDGIDLCRKHAGKEAVVVLDPTLLCKDYPKPAATRTGRPYICSFDIVNDPGVESLVRRIARKERAGKKFLRGGVFSRSIIKNVGNLSLASIPRWLETISGAEFVITNSFHGLAFCLNYSREFAVLVRSGEAKNGRIVNLLRIAGLENRLFFSEEEIWHFYQEKSPIDYNEVGKRLEPYREASVSYLKKWIVG